MRPETIKGHLDGLLLAVVADEPAHGYAIVERLRERSGGAFALPEGTVYPALYRLERLGLLASEAQQVAGRTRRIYRTTAAGRAALRKRRGAWRRLIESVGAVLDEPAVAGHA